MFPDRVGGSGAEGATRTSSPPTPGSLGAYHCPRDATVSLEGSHYNAADAAAALGVVAIHTTLQDTRLSVCCR